MQIRTLASKGLRVQRARMMIARVVRELPGPSWDCNGVDEWLCGRCAVAIFPKRRQSWHSASSRVPKAWSLKFGKSGGLSCWWVTKANTTTRGKSRDVAVLAAIVDRLRRGLLAGLGIITTSPCRMKYARTMRNRGKLQAPLLRELMTLTSAVAIFCAHATLMPWCQESRWKSLA